jgi:hypothetical protein
MGQVRPAARTLTLVVPLDSPDTSRRLNLIRRAPGWVCLGVAGSVLTTLAGARLTGGSVRWWFHPTIPPGGDTNVVALYLGMVMLAAAWIGLRRHASAPRSTPRQLWPVGLLWSLPLALGAPLFSHDVYSYLAQGTIAHLGLSPYRASPAVLGHLGHARMMAAVDPFWLHETAPYGPLFLAAVSAVAAITGSHLIAGVLLVRLVELIGLVLLWVFVPRLARALGADPSRALWLTVLSPLILLQLVAASHNDLLMIGLMLAGVTFAVEGRPLLGIAICVLAMTVKLPAGVAAPFIAVAWIRGRPGWPARLRASAETIVVAVAIIGVVSLATGWGLHWFSSTLFSTPARVRLAITPATGVGWTLSSLLHDAGVGASFMHIESVTRVIAAAITGVIALVLLARTRRENMVRMLGIVLVALALGGPAAWPWYLTWGIVLLAASTPFQLSRTIPVALAVTAFLVKANGILVLPLRSAPIVLGVYLVIGCAAWYTWRRRRATPQGADRPDTIRSAASSALARSSTG